MSKLKTKNLILISFLVPIMVLSTFSLAVRFKRRPNIPTVPAVKPVVPIKSPTTTTPTPTPPSMNIPIPTPTPTPIINGIKKSTYLWGIFDPNTINSYIDGASSNGISIIYLDVEPFANNNFTIQQSIAKLAPVVQYARSKNVDIHGLIGAPTFAQPNERYLVLKALEVIKQFNNSQVIPIKGIHLNIEFYNIPAFQQDSGTTIKNQILINYLDFHKTVSQETRGIQLKVPTFEFSSTLPHFTDFQRADNPIPYLMYDQQFMSVFEQVSKVLNSTPNSSIVIMSYRSTAIGEDSISGLVANEFKQITKYKTKIVIGVETNDIQSSYVSMFGKSKSEINSIMSQVHDVYKASPNYDGIAIHEIKAYLKAK
jgi:hypothetical protein